MITRSGYGLKPALWTRTAFPLSIRTNSTEHSIDVLELVISQVNEENSKKNPNEVPELYEVIERVRESHEKGPR